MPDIRLIYIGSPARAVSYGRDHLLPAPCWDEVVAVQAPDQLAGLTLPPWCHIAIELHKDSRGTRPSLDNANAVFEAARARRRPIDKAGA